MSITLPEKKASFAQVASSSGRVWEITVPYADGRQAFYKLAVRPLKEAAFRKACDEGLSVNLADYGEIIESRIIPNVRKVKYYESNS